MSFEIGLDKIDREYSIKNGSVISYTYPMESNGEKLIHQILNKNMKNFNQSTYITINKNKSLLDNIFNNSNILNDTPLFIDLSDEDIGENTFKNILEYVDKIDNCMIILDSVDPLEENESDEYRKFINKLVLEIKNRDSILILISSPSKSQNRNYTNDVADIVFEITIDKSPTELKPYLNLRKNRFNSYSDFSDKIWSIKFKDEEVSIDTSRDIS